MTWPRVQQLTAGVLLLFACLVGVQSVQLSLYSRLGPGPGLFPLVLAVVLGGLATALLVQASLGKVGDAPEPVAEDAPATARQRRIVVVAALVGVVLLLEPLGFRLTILAFLLVLIPALGERRWAVTVPVAVLVAFGTYEAFDGWLGLPLPAGPLGL